MIELLLSTLPGARFTGLGGAAMRHAGQLQTVRAEDVAVMGITEILRHVPRIYARYRRLVRSIRSNRPDVAVLIDFPDVNFRLARHLHAAGVPVLWLVSPQLWAWKRRRLRWMQERVSRIFVIFPFEQTFYEARGVPATFIGHPLATLPTPSVSREDLAARQHLDPARQWMALLPGSRRREVLANLPDLLAAAAILNRTHPARFEFLLPVASTVSGPWIESLLTADPNTPRIHLVPDAREALHHSRAAAVASGTATVQTALLGTPFVVVYHVSALTYALARRLIRYPVEIRAARDRHGNLPIAMPNLIAGHRLVPELLYRQFTPEAVAAQLLQLADDTPARSAQLAGFHDLRHQLQAPPDQPDPLAVVVEHLLHLLGNTSP